MASLNILLIIILVITIIIQIIFFWIPLGNENSTVRRLPLITFGIIALNVLIFLGSLPILVQQHAKIQETYTDLQEFLERNPALMADKEVRKKLIDAQLATEEDLAEMDEMMKGAEAMEEAYPGFLSEMRSAEARVDFDMKLAAFEKAMKSNLYYSLGIAPNGKWKTYQLLTHMFMHGGWFHLIGNMFFFFAIGFSLEDLWGRGLFLGFYIGAGFAACLPQLLFPESVPAIGASGAISAAMGAFLIRLPKTKIKIGWMFLPFLLWNIIRYLLSGKKFFGVVNIPAYIFLPYYFMVQVASFWAEKKMGGSSGVAFSVHIAGFVFGAAFALVIKGAKVEEKYIHPSIEGKISFDASPIVNESLALLDRGDVVTAESKLQTHLARSPQDMSAMMTLIQLYQNTGNFDQLNNMYARVIRQHFAQGDKEGALYAYDGLLSSFPDDAVNPKIFIRDWMMICEYVRELGMPLEASVEYERLVKTCLDDPLVIRACIQGGEAALAADHKERALRLFEWAMTLNPSGAYQNRIARGLAVCRGAAGGNGLAPQGANRTA